MEMRPFVLVQPSSPSSAACVEGVHPSPPGTRSAHTHKQPLAMESSEWQRLTDDADDDVKRDWAALPLDIVKICLSAPQLKRDTASKSAALISCKTFGRAVVRSSTHQLHLKTDRKEPPLASTTGIWAELWGEEPLCRAGGLQQQAP